MSARRLHFPGISRAATGSICVGLVTIGAASPAEDWKAYLGGEDRNHYSELADITIGNVGTLRPVWEFHTGVLGQMQCSPIVVDRVLFGVAADNSVFALDAASGRELWRYSPPEARVGATLRGVTYWKSGDDARILFSAGEWLYAINAGTGTLKLQFGEAGRVSLKTGLGASAQSKWVVSTTSGALYGNNLIMPLRVSEGADAGPGFVQAFDVRTGALVWVFKTIPSDGDPAAQTWNVDGQVSRSVGGANSWAGIAIDSERGIAFVPTGSASPDFFGGDRPGDNLYANCLLALDASTGRLLWHRQLVRHDLWDRDLPAPPNLVTVRRGDLAIPAVAQVTKTGHVFVFDRVTGDSLFPLREFSVPASEIPGEKAAPTQILPLLPLPFARQIEESSINPWAADHNELLERFRNARKGRFQPFGVYETILRPGFDGGAEWGGAAVSPGGMLYINANEMAWIARLRPVMVEAEGRNMSKGERVYSTYCIACHGIEKRGNPVAGIPDLVGLQTRRTREEIYQLSVDGRGMMPGFPALSREDRDTLIDHLLGAEKTETDGVAVAGLGGTIGSGTGYTLDGYVKFLDRQGYPAIAPPWGTMTAIDLNTGEHVWQIPLGEYPELTESGIPVTGMENYGGPIVTASGLLFIAATKGGKFRAFDCRDGKKLWEWSLPAAGFATPITYKVDGRQYVLLACGGTKLGTKSGDSYVAFGLP